MECKRLTTISEVTDSPTLKILCESCGESSCDEICCRYQDNYCEGCPVQEAFARLAAYEDSGLTPEEVQEFAEAKAEGRLRVLLKPAYNVGDLVRIVDAADHTWIGRRAKIKSISNYLNTSILYRLDIGGGDWLQSTLTKLPRGRDNHV